MLIDLESDEVIIVRGALGINLRNIQRTGVKDNRVHQATARAFRKVQEALTREGKGNENYFLREWHSIADWILEG